MTNANNINNLAEGLYYHHGRANPSNLTNYPSITDFSTAGMDAAYNLLTFNQAGRVVQWCIIIYYTTGQSWVSGRRYTRVKIDSTWLPWETF